jgi:hypothetical protein
MLYVTAADTEREVKMYSPKIDEKLIPAPYRLARALIFAMTGLVKAMTVTGIERSKRRKNLEHDASTSF